MVQGLRVLAKAKAYGDVEQTAADRHVLLEYVLKVLMYQRPVLGTKPLTPLEAAAAEVRVRV